MIQIGICDDDAYAREALQIELEKILIEKKEEIVYEFSSGKGCVNWIKNHPGEIDLLFLDIEMDILSGIQAAREIRTFDQNLQLVFVTGYSDFVFEGYRVQALDYLMKPVDPFRLLEVINRVRRHYTSSENNYFIFQNTEGRYRILKSHISYLYSEKRKVVLVSHNKEFPFYGKLNEVEKELGEGFIRIHQRYLINAAFVSQVTPSRILVEHTYLPVSRSMKESALSALAKEMMKEAHPL